MRLPLCLAIRSLSRNADDPARSGGVAALQRLIAPATTVARTWSQFSLGRRLQPVRQRLVVLAVRAHVGGERRVAASLPPAAGLLERAAQAEVRVVVHGVALHHGRELLRGLVEAARAEVCAAQRLADRALVGLQGARALQWHRGGHEVALLEQLASLLEQFVGVLGAHCPGSTVVGPAAGVLKRSTSSRIAAATSVFGRRPTCRSPSASTIVTSLSVLSNPMSEREMSFTTTAYRALRTSFSRPRSTAPSPCSAANPITVWSGRRPAATAAPLSVVGSSSMLRPWLPSRGILASVGDAGRKSDGAAAMISTSASEKRSRTAASSSAVVSTGTAVAGSASVTFAATSVTSAPRRAASSASASPIRPDERLPT